MRRQTVEVDRAAVEQALQQVYASRVYLGLPPQPANGHDLAEVPPDLEQTFSAVRTALYNLVQTMAQIGLNLVREHDTVTPRQLLADFRKRDARGDIDRILKELIPNAPAVKQAEAKLLQARADLDQALLNLRYCDVVSEIDGVVTRRNVNPGNNVSAGQSLMAIRSLTEIWIDCQLQGDSARGPAHRPAGALRGRHVRRAGVSTRAASPASQWGPARRWPCSRRRTPPATS